MPRKLRDDRLDTRTARLKLAARREPYWRSIQEGRAVGYRRIAGKAGTWIARTYSPLTGRRFKALGSADDAMDADGIDTLSFSQAQAAAIAWFAQLARDGGKVVKPITVGEAARAYLEDFKARGAKSLAETTRTIEAHILPELGDILVRELTTNRIKTWQQGLATAPARLRSKPNAAKLKTRAASDADGRRARRATANRIASILKAILNKAFQDGRAPTDEAWRRVKPFQKVDTAKIRYLTDDDARRLVNACAGGFRKLVVAALLTGCRYGELTVLRAGDFDPDAGVLHLRDPKVRPRSVPLTDDAMKFFTGEAAGRATSALLLTRDDGQAWGKSHQFRPLRAACAAARIEPAVSFHILCHTFASRMAMKNVPMHVIAAAIGDTEIMCARHYAHLAPGYVASAIRQHAGGMGLVPEDNPVTPMRKGRS